MLQDNIKYNSLTRSIGGFEQKSTVPLLVIYLNHKFLHFRTI